MSTTPDASFFTGEREPWGRRSVLIRIGSQCLEFTGLDDRLAELIESNYRGFVAGTGSIPTLSISSRPTALELLRAEEGERLDGPDEPEVVTGEEAFLVRGAGWTGRLARDGFFGRVLTGEPDDERLGQALDRFLRLAVSTVALRGGGLLFAGSARAADGKSRLLLDPNGAGGDAGSAELPPGTVGLGQGFALVEPSRTGFRACGVPFRESFAGEERNSSACATLAVVGVVGDAEPTASELLNAVPFTLDDPARLRQARAALDSLRTAVEWRRLAPRADGDYWPELN